MSKEQKKAVVYGAGSVGRGFIGQLFSQSGFEVVFVDLDARLVNLLEKARQYPVRLVNDRGFSEILVGNVRAVDGAKQEHVLGLLCAAEVAATAVGVRALASLARPIASGLQNRWANGNFSPLNILVCENEIHANRRLKKLVMDELPSETHEQLEEVVGFVEVSVGRNIAVMTPELWDGNPLRLVAESYDSLPVDKDSIRGEMPSVSNMRIVSPFEPCIHQKLFMYNMAHAVVAYLGYLLGNKYLCDAVRNSSIRFIARNALAESARALSKEDGTPLDGLLEHADELLVRFENRLLGITIERTGMDPLRKLSNGDRLIGAAMICKKWSVVPVYISMGAAAAFLFDPPNDPTASEVAERVKVGGIHKAISSICGLEKEDPVLNSIALNYEYMITGKSLEQIIGFAPRLADGSTFPDRLVSPK